jgi:hypothetical protein
VWTLVRSDTHVEAVINGVDRNPGIMLMSIVEPGPAHVDRNTLQ